MRRIALQLSLVALLCAPSFAASAQVAPPDVVRTTDGGIYRGTILEFVPGDHLVLLLPSGERRTFAGTEIATTESTTPPAPPAQATHTGVVANDSSASGYSNRPSYPASQGRSVRLRVESATPGTTLLRQSGMGVGVVGNQTAYVMQFERMCTAPCDVEIDRGNHQFVVEDQDGRQRAVPSRTMVESDGTLSIGMESRRKQRIRRWIATLALYTLSIPFIVRGTSGNNCVDEYYSDYCEANWRLLGPGLGIMGVGYGMMFGAIFTRDRGQADFTPGY